MNPGITYLTTCPRELLDKQKPLRVKVKVIVEIWFLTRMYARERG